MQDDWAYLEKYALENEKLNLKVNSGNRIVFIGDSITEYWKQYDASFFSQNGYINRGISSQTTTQISFRFQNDALKIKPKKIVILAGINDIAENNGPISLDEIVINIQSMIKRALDNKIEVILCSLLPVAIIPWNHKINPVEKVVELNNRLKKISEANSIPYVDYFSNMADDTKGLPKKYSHDGVHPNEKGYLKMKVILENYLK